MHQEMTFGTPDLFQARSGIFFFQFRNSYSFEFVLSCILIITNGFPRQ